MVEATRMPDRFCTGVRHSLCDGSHSRSNRELRPTAIRPHSHYQTHRTMNPSQTLILLLFTGAAGSALLTWLFFVVASRFLNCPECRRSRSSRRAYCVSCGTVVSSQQASDAEHRHPAAGPTAHDTMTPSHRDELRRLCDALCRLSPEDRAGLNLMMKDQADNATPCDPVQ